MVIGASWLNRGQVWKALVAREADQIGEMPEGSVLVLKDGDISIPTETISKSVAVVIEQNDRNSHIVQLCSYNLDPQGQKSPIPCIVNLVGLFDWVKRFDYLEINSRIGTVTKINPGLFTSTSTYKKPQINLETEESDPNNPNKETPKRSFIDRLLGR